MSEALEMVMRLEKLRQEIGALAQLIAEQGLETARLTRERDEARAEVASLTHQIDQLRVGRG